MCRGESNQKVVECECKVDSCVLKLVRENWRSRAIPPSSAKPLAFFAAGRFSEHTYPLAVARRRCALVRNPGTCRDRTTWVRVLKQRTLTPKQRPKGCRSDPSVCLTRPRGCGVGSSGLCARFRRHAQAGKSFLPRFQNCNFDRRGVEHPHTRTTMGCVCVRSEVNGRQIVRRRASGS